MFKWRRRAFIALLLVIFSLVPLPLAAQETVELEVYSSPTCDHCHLVREQVLEPLQAAYGERLQVSFVDVSTAKGLERLEALEELLGQPNNPLPVIHLQEELIASEDLFEVQDALRERLQDILGPPQEPEQAMPEPEPTETVRPTDAAEPTETHGVSEIHVAYIEKDGCLDCGRAHVALQAVRGECPQMRIHTFNNMHDTDLVEAMGEYLGLPEEQRLIAPSVYMGRDVLIGKEITVGNLRALLDEYATSGTPAFWEDLDIDRGKSSIVARFQEMGPLAVIVAALIDGVNPCAFATILFFVSYLAISRRPRREILAIGLAFTVGVFVTYLLVGLGAMSLLKLVNTIKVVGMVLYGAMAVGCFVLAGISVRDYALARQGRFKEMTLNLPDRLRDRIKGRIRAASGAYIGAALVSGLVVSLLELACTGQVYLPTISFVVGIPQMRASAISYLVIYNLVFILPLVVILFLAVYGVSAARLQDWFVQNAAKTKLIMAVLFLVLGGLLVSQVLAL